MPSSMHRHNAIRTQAPSPVANEPLVRPFNVIVGGVLPKGSTGQIGRAVIKRIACCLVHGGSVQRGLDFFYSHFPSPDSFVYGANVAVGNAN